MTFFSFFLYVHFLPTNFTEQRIRGASEASVISSYF